MDRHGYTHNIRNLCKLEPSTHPVEKKLSSDRSVHRVSQIHHALAPACKSRMTKLILVSSSLGLLCRVVDRLNPGGL
jgi:hypothetical protein